MKTQGRLIDNLSINEIYIKVSLQKSIFVNSATSPPIF